jgi:hypothetical protein
LNVTPEIETQTVETPTVEEDIEAMLRDVRAFLDDPVALVEHALEVMRRQFALSQPPH